MIKETLLKLIKNPINSYKKNRGISITEILIAIAVLTTLFLIILPQFSKIRENQVLKNTVGETTSILLDAKSQSIASVNSSEYGVHFQSDKIIYFKGKVFSQGAVDNKIINLTTPATISNVTFNGSSSTQGDVYFGRLNGIPSKTGTVTIVVSSLSKIVTISSTGAISAN